MKIIPVLNIEQFEHKVPLSDFYSNDLRTHLQKNAAVVNKPHSHNFYLCVLFSKGNGVHEIDFNTYMVNPGSVFFLKPGQTHHWKFTSEPEGYIFFHTQDFYELHFSTSKLEQFPFYYSHKNTPSLNISQNKITQLAPIYKAINNEYYDNLPYKKQKIASLIHTAYIDLARLYNTKTITTETNSIAYIETLRALEKEIETHYKTEKSAQFYANKLHITAKHLNRICKVTLNKTTTDLITERVILESKRLLVHSKNTMYSISENLGFKDYAYFSRVFKSKTKVTPLEFKKSYQ
ncbi:MAG: AraC family transcriptional regulator [Cellulophaga sp.]|uniref:AraC family transcriptional regulator n=1 Tax=Cellulophaga sp. TaxID=1972202 RepID=UPI003266C605